MKIYRYSLDLADAVELELPAGAQVLSVGPPRAVPDELDMWALVDPAATQLELRSFRIVGTGNPMPADCGRFVGTTHSHAGSLIWHVFEAKESAGA